MDEHDVRVLLQQTPSGDSLRQTFIDRYIEQGRVQGQVQGWEQGIEQGKQQGEAAVLLRQILLKFSPPSPAVYRLVSAADTETLLRWSERRPATEPPPRRSESSANLDTAKST